MSHGRYIWYIHSNIDKYQTRYIKKWGILLSTVHVPDEKKKRKRKKCIQKKVRRWYIRRHAALWQSLTCATQKTPLLEWGAMYIVARIISQEHQELCGTRSLCIVGYSVGSGACQISCALSWRLCVAMRLRVCALVWAGCVYSEGLPTGGARWTVGSVVVNDGGDGNLKLATPSRSFLHWLWSFYVRSILCPLRQLLLNNYFSKPAFIACATGSGSWLLASPKPITGTSTFVGGCWFTPQLVDLFCHLDYEWSKCCHTHTTYGQGDLWDIKQVDDGCIVCWVGRYTRYILSEWNP